MPALFFPEDSSLVDQRLAAAFDGATGDLFPDHRIPGTPGYNLRTLWARLFQLHYQELNAYFTSLSPRTAGGSALDDWAAFFGLSRKGRRAASGRLLLTSQVTGSALERLAGTRTLPVGTRFTVGGLSAISTEEVTFPPNERQVEVAVDAEQTYAATMAVAGTPLTLAARTALRDLVRAEVLTDIAGGAEAETDGQLRYRLVHALVNPATPLGFETRLLSNTNVSRVEVTENGYGPGTIEAFVIPAIAFPPAALRRELEALWQGPGRAYVVFPDYEALVLRIRVTGPASAALVTEFVNNLQPGDVFVLNALETALQNAGARDAQVLGIKRGPVAADGTYGGLSTLRQVTNQSPASARSKWYTQDNWITFCS